jgi:hypothetical protein
MEAELEGKQSTYILDTPYRWESWAAPKGKDGKLYHNTALTGDDLRDFVNQKLFPYLHGFTQKASGPNTIEYKIGEIFSELKNRIQSGYNLREVINRIDELRFRTHAEKHEMKKQDIDNLDYDRDNPEVGLQFLLEKRSQGRFENVTREIFPILIARLIRNTSAHKIHSIDLLYYKFKEIFQSLMESVFIIAGQIQD